MRYHRHNQWVLGLVAGALAAIAAFTVAIDAAGLWGAPTIRGVNGFKARQHQYELAAKAAAFARDPRPAVFLGSSRVKYGLDPAAYERLTGRGAYNLGVGGLAPAGHGALFAHALAHRPDLAEVVLGLGHHDLLPPDVGPRARADEAAAYLTSRAVRARDLARHAFTFTALGDAAATVRASWASPDARAYSPDGRDLVQPWITGLEATGTREHYLYGLRRYAGRGGVVGYDPAQLEWVRALAATCRARGVKLTVFVPPVHALEYEGAWGTPGWAQILRGKRALAAITPYWDFSGYNAVTTEPLAASMRNYLDVTHFRPVVGDAILARLAAGPGARPGFGRHVTARSVEASIRALEAERAAWVATDPADLRLRRAVLAGLATPGPTKGQGR